MKSWKVVQLCLSYYACGWSPSRGNPGKSRGGPRQAEEDPASRATLADPAEQHCAHPNRTPHTPVLSVGCLTVWLCPCPTSSLLPPGS